MADVNMIVEGLLSWAVGLPAIGVIVAYGLSIIRRRASEDRRSIGDDKAHTSMIDRYKQERDIIKDEKDKIINQLIAVETQRNTAMSQVSSLSVEVGYLTAQVTELKALVEKLTASLDLARSEMQHIAIENAKLVAHVSFLEENKLSENGQKNAN